MEEFAQGVTGAKAALYQILYQQTPVANNPWHQDHDHFFLTEYNRTHLNYWIPLVKPSRTEAGLRVIPWDRLREKSPCVFNLCRRSGASRLYSLRDGGTLYFSDWSGVIWHEEDLEIEDVMETPEVGPGDLLLLSLNNIHATQTTDDRRLAVSLRTCDPATPIDWHRVAGSPTPRSMQYLGGFKGGDRSQQVDLPGLSSHPGKRAIRRSFVPGLSAHLPGGHSAGPPAESPRRRVWLARSAGVNDRHLQALPLLCSRDMFLHSEVAG